MGTTKSVSIWLYSCCVAIFVMVVIGGLTRLTDSGLSIMTWEPLSGAIPPLNEAEWQRYFDDYRQIGEYQFQNKGMSLEEFKGIFWLEYIHRLFGRLVGLIFFIPLVYFVIKKAINKPIAIRLGFVLLMGGLQGFIGWYMVSSGFSERTDVSQYRLAIHLMMAFTIFGILYWTALDVHYLRNVRVGGRISPICWAIIAITGLVLLQILLGAFVAGTDAGFTYNTFPWMDGKLVPDGLYLQSPWWINHFENITMIQFQHRLLGMVVGALICIFAFFYVRHDFNNFSQAVGLVLLLVLQIALGIMTLNAFGSFADYEGVDHAYKKVLYFPVVVAVAHQANALLLFAILLRITHKLLRN